MSNKRPNVKETYRNSARLTLLAKAKPQQGGDISASDAELICQPYDIPDGEEPEVAVNRLFPR